MKSGCLPLSLCVLFACSEPYDSTPPASVDGGGGDADATVKNCDRDGDQWLAFDCVDGGQFDCDDDDPNTNPSRDFLDILPTAPRNGDWNCASGVEKRYKSGIDCSGFSTDCAGREGFEDDPGCGQEGSFVECKMLTSTCTTTRSRRKQGCR